MDTSSDEEEFEDLSNDYEESYYTTTTDDDDDTDDREESPDPQPIHFRECLRLLDSALTTNNPPILPRWCASEQINVVGDPMLLINGHHKCLSLPLDRREAKRFTGKATPLYMKIDIADGISFSTTSRQIAANSFSILNAEWKQDIESHLKRTCIAKSLELDPNGVELRVSSLVLLEPCPYPRQFIWPKSEQNSPSIAKLFVSLPSKYKGGRETIVHQKEKHVFDLSEKDPLKPCFYTVVPFSDECKHEIDFISDGYKLMLIYDVIPLSPTIYYHVTVHEETLARVSKALEAWLHGLEHNYHSYSSKIIIPFSDTCRTASNLLLHGIDRVTGTIFRRIVGDRFLLYQGVVQPNRSSDGTVHVCRLLNDLYLINETNTNTFFNTIKSCLGNCNETYSGNIFLRKTRSEQGNFISVEQFVVPIWCLVPMNYKHDLFVDNIPCLFTHLEEDLIPDRHGEIFELTDWLLTSPKKINFNAKLLLRLLLQLLPDSRITQKLNATIRLLLEHRRFVEHFFPMDNKQDYDDIVHLLKYSQDDRIQLYLHETFRTVLKRRSRDTNRIRDAIKFIGILYEKNADTNLVFALIHELLSDIFKTNDSMPSMTDLANLLTLLSVATDSFDPSCQVITQQIIRQIQISAVTTTNRSTLTMLLRTVLVPTLIEIYRHFLNENQSRRKRKRDTMINLPSWFLSLYQACLSLLNTYCNSSPSIPIYENLSNIFHECCCSFCEQLFKFLQNTNILEEIFIIPKDKIDHFNTILNQFHPLIIVTKSMMSDIENHQINIIKMSVFDEEICRESNLLRSLLFSIDVSNHVEIQCDAKRKKRFKSSM